VAAILSLTVRQLVGSRRAWLVAALVGLPVLVAALSHLADSTANAGELADNLTGTLIASGTLPLVLLLLGTASLGNELSDRTLVYLTTKPLARWHIVAPKLLAPMLVGAVPVAVGGGIAVALTGAGGFRGAAATGIGLLAGGVAYAAVFTWAGLATRHALLLGLVYVFIWEAALARYLDGIRYLSVRRFALGVIEGIDGTRLTTLERPPGVLPSALLAGGVVVVFALLAVRRLRRLDVP